MSLTLSERMTSVYRPTQAADTLAAEGIVYSPASVALRGSGTVRQSGFSNAQLHSLEERLRAIAFLGENWDSYGAGEFDEYVLQRVEKFVLNVLRSGVPLPDLTPSSSGSVIAEWRDGTDLLEVHLDPAGEDLVYLEESGETTVEYEGIIDNIPEADRVRLEGFLTRLAERGMNVQD